MRLWLILPVFLTSLAYSQAPLCLFSFATLSEAPAPDEGLIGDTYERLIVTLGDRLSLPAFEKLAKSGDPFTLPPEGFPLDGLQQKLKEFERLLELKGWNTPAIHTHLMSRVIALKAGRETARQQQERVSEKSWLDYSLDLRLQQDFIPTPDGRIMVGAEGGFNRPARWTYYDPETRKQWNYDVPGVYETSPPLPHFLPGGKEVLVLANNVFWRVPLVGDRPDWASKKVITPPPGKMPWGNIHSGRSPHYVYFDSGPEPLQIVRLDLRTNSFMSLPVERVRRGVKNKIVDWGIVPGSDNLYFLVDEEKLARVEMVRAGRNGKLVSVGKGPSWPKPPGNTEDVPDHLKWSADGKTGYAVFDSIPRIDSFSVGKATATPIPAAQADGSHSDGLFFHLTLDSRGELGAFFKYLSDSGAVRIFDQKTGQAVASIPVPDNSGDVVFSGDGSRLFVPTGRKGILVINTERYRQLGSAVKSPP